MDEKFDLKLCKLKNSLGENQGKKILIGDILIGFKFLLCFYLLCSVKILLLYFEKGKQLLYMCYFVSSIVYLKYSFQDSYNEPLPKSTN